MGRESRIFIVTMEGANFIGMLVVDRVGEVIEVEPNEFGLGAWPISLRRRRIFFRGYISSRGAA